MIKWLVALLLIVNVLFGAYLQMGAPARSPDAQLVDLQMNAPMVRVIAGGEDQPPAAARKAAPGPVASACLAWGPFAPGEAERAREALADLVPAERVSAREVGAPASFWVYLPPQKTRAEAQKKAAELKSLGIADYSIVDNDPAWTHAIALGVFGDEAAARDALARLQKAGVRTAAIGERTGRRGVQWLVREPGEAVTARVLEIKQASFPESALGAIECPPATPR